MSYTLGSVRLWLRRKEKGDILFIGKPQARGLIAQVAEPVAGAHLDLPPGVSVEELDLLVVRGSGDEVVLHVEAGARSVVVPVTICRALDIWATHSVGVEGRSGAEVVGQKLKKMVDGQGLEKSEILLGGGRGRDLRCSPSLLPRFFARLVSLRG